MSSYTRQCFSLYHAQCRVTLDCVFYCTRSNFELHSTVLSAIPDPLSSYTRQCFPLYHTQCRVTLDSAFRYTMPNIELHSTVFSTVPDPMSSYSRQCFLLYRAQYRTQIDNYFRFFFPPLSFYFFITALNLENFRLFAELIWKRLSKCIRIILTVKYYGHAFR